MSDLKFLQCVDFELAKMAMEMPERLNPDELELPGIQTPSEFEDEAWNNWKPSEEDNFNGKLNVNAGLDILQRLRTVDSVLRSGVLFLSHSISLSRCAAVLHRQANLWNCGHQEIFMEMPERLNPDELELPGIQTPSEFEDEAWNNWKPSEEDNFNGKLNVNACLDILQRLRTVDSVLRSGVVLEEITRHTISLSRCAAVLHRQANLWNCGHQEIFMEMPERLNPDELELPGIQTPLEFEDEALNNCKPSEEVNFSNLHVNACLGEDDFLQRPWVLELDSERELFFEAYRKRFSTTGLNAMLTIAPVGAFQAIDIMLQVANAMNHMNRKHVIHRALKPATKPIASATKMIMEMCERLTLQTGAPWNELEQTFLEFEDALNNCKPSEEDNFDGNLHWNACLRGTVFLHRQWYLKSVSGKRNLRDMNVLTTSHVYGYGLTCYEDLRGYSSRGPWFYVDSSDLLSYTMWKQADEAAAETHPDPELRECNLMFVHRLGDLDVEGVTRPCTHNVLQQDEKFEEEDGLNSPMVDATGRDSMRQTDDAVSNQFAKAIQPPAHEKPSSEQEVFDNDYESMSCDSWASHGSQAEVTADSACDEGDSKYATGKKRPRESKLEDDYLNMATLLPLLRKEVEEAVHSMLLPLVSALRSREENEQMHRERVLSLEREKVLLKREQFLFKRRRLARSQARTSTVSPSTLTSGSRPRSNRHGLRPKHLARY